VIAALSMGSVSAAACLTLVFAQAAVHKATDFGSFTGFVADYQIVPKSIETAVARAVVAVETALVVLLIIDATRIIGAMLAMILLSGYAAAIAINLRRGRVRVLCGCGGAPQYLSSLLVARNFVLSALAALVVYVFVREPTGNQAFLNVREGAVAIIGGTGLWLAFLLFEQVFANRSLAKSL
jgi:hypothetical protein